MNEHVILKTKGKDEKDKKKGNKNIIIGVLSLIVVIIGYAVINGVFEHSYEIGAITSNPVTFALSFIALAILFIGIYVFGKKKNIINNKETTDKQRNDAFKSIHYGIVIFAILSGIWYTVVNFEFLTALPFSIAVVFVAIFTGMIFVIFELFVKFNLAGRRFVDALPKFIYELFISVFIPGTILIIILLGALQANYNYDSVFKQNVTNESIPIIQKALDNGLVQGANDLIFKLYDMGQARPVLWLWLSILGFIFLFILAFIRSFWDNRTDEEKEQAMSMQQLLKVWEKNWKEDEIYALKKKEKDAKRKQTGFFYRINNFFKEFNNEDDTKKGKKAKEKEERELQSPVRIVKITEFKTAVVKEGKLKDLLDEVEKRKEKEYHDNTKKEETKQ